MCGAGSSSCSTARCRAPAPTTTPGSSARSGWCAATAARPTWSGSGSGTRGPVSRSDPDLFAAHGGAFPVLVAGVGLVGTVAVSGLPQLEDHLLVVEALQAFLADG